MEIGISLRNGTGTQNTNNCGWMDTSDGMEVDCQLVGLASTEMKGVEVYNGAE